MSWPRSLRLLPIVLALAALGVLPARAQTLAPYQRGAAADDAAFITDFLENGYLQSWFAYPEIVRQHFADPVENYWGRRDVPLSEVVRDKVAYAKKWTFRFYRLKTDTVDIRPVAERAGVYEVAFAYDFVADSLPPRSAGVGETTLVVQIVGEKGDRIKILSEMGRVLKRQAGQRQTGPRE